MAFRFPLDPVLRHRKRLEDVAARDLGLAQQHVEVAERALGQIRAEAASYQHELSVVAQRGSTGIELGTLARAVEEFHDGAARAAADVAAKRQRLERARAALVEASRAHRMLERLEESARAAYTRRVAVLDQRENDEVGAAGYLWRRAEAGRGKGGSTP
jgi:flagellar export protein FliJ